MADQIYVLADLAAVTDSFYPGSRRLAPPTAGFGAFGIAVPGHGPVVVFVVGDDPWWIRFVSAIRRAILSADSALMWCNRQNVTTNTGRFATAPSTTRPGTYNIVHRTTLSSDDLLEVPQHLDYTVLAYMKLAVHLSSPETLKPRGIEALGGVAFTDSDEDREEALISDKSAL